jgi:hypothetical protein
MLKMIYQKFRKAQFTDQIITVATCVIAVSTIVYTVISIIQTTISQNIFTTTQDQFRVAQRAFISTKGVIIQGAEGIKLGVKPKGYPEIDVIYENSGQTPASKVIVDFDYCVISGELPEKFNFQHIPESKVIVGEASVGPRLENSFFHKIPTDDLIDIQVLKKNLFVYGQISYSDIFKNSHKTQFCFRSNGILYDDAGIIRAYAFIHCKKHNCADEDCDNQ